MSIYKHTASYFVILSGLILSLSACNQNRVESTPELREEMQSMKIQRITPNQLSTALHELGSKIAQAASIAIDKQLSKGGSDTLCIQPSLNNVIRQLNEEYDIDIQLKFEKDADDLSLSGTERELIAAYAFSAKQGNTSLDANIQALNDSTTLFNIPLAADNLLFQKCSEAQASPIVLWHIVFNNKQIIKRLDPKFFN